MFVKPNSYVSGISQILIANTITNNLVGSASILSTMVRHYKKKKSVGSEITDEQLKYYLQQVTEKSISVNQLAKNIGMAESTLRRKLHRLRKGQSQVERKSGGRYSLPKESEEELAEALALRVKYGFTSTGEEVRDVVQHYVRSNKVNDTPLGIYLKKYCTFKNDRPGEDWLYSFMKRYGLSLKKPSSLKKTRKLTSSNPIITPSPPPSSSLNLSKGHAIADRYFYDSLLADNLLQVSNVAAKHTINEKTTFKPKQVHSFAVILTDELRNELEMERKERDQKEIAKKQRAERMAEKKKDREEKTQQIKEKKRKASEESKSKRQTRRKS